MFIVHGRDAYVRPHRHLHRPEGIFVIEGKVDIILFSDAGCIKDVIRLDQAAFYLRLAEPVYHMLIIRSRELVFHEATTGPFEPADSEFAAWSPEDADTIGIALFLERVEAEITRFGDGGKGA
jgi:cupin fold WbuC family metalloprotein